MPGVRLQRALLNSPLYSCPDLDSEFSPEDIERAMIEPALAEPEWPEPEGAFGRLPPGLFTPS